MTKINTDPKKIEQLLSRGVENIYPNREFLAKLLASGKRLTLYTGYDPTAPTLHIGHAITLLKLRDFQELGHKVIMLIGDFTGMIGDPTDKSATRQQLTREQVMANCKEYKKQASAILNFGGKNKAEIKYNSQWLAKLSFADVLQLSSHFSVQRLLERDMFQKRFYGEIYCKKCNKYVLIKNLIFNIGSYEPKKEESFLASTEGENHKTTCPSCSTEIDLHDMNTSVIPPIPIYLHEFMYPLMQAYDCVAMDVDGEVGGNDQTFNMLAGRKLMKKIKNKEKFVLTTHLLTDSSGQKMGKTEGNMVALSASAQDMFGGVMSWSDELIINGFILCTRLPEEEIKKIEQSLKSGVNPRDLKARLALEITKMYHGEAAARKAEQEFDKVFKEKKSPEDIKTIKIHLGGEIKYTDLMFQYQLSTSRGAAARLIDQGAVNEETEEGGKLTRRTITDRHTRILLDRSRIITIRVGPRHFLRLDIK